MRLEGPIMCAGTPRGRDCDYQVRVEGAQRLDMAAS